MELTWHGVSDRYKAQLAPDGLHLTQALANSVALAAPRDTDPLGELGTAQAWIEELANEWVKVHRGLVPDITLTARGLTLVRRLRSTVRDALLRETAATLWAPIEISVEGDVLAVTPTGADGRWLESAVGAELLLAQQDNTLRRLKLCRNPACRAAFYDLSKNSSKIWHDMAKCGTPMHVREYRKRLKSL
ncbi:MAG: CGNR zinc finger domain-containing protein [Trebonia sp.]|jgi:predicted RNA-binding Zn ribbon-like protein